MGDPQGSRDISALVEGKRQVYGDSWRLLSSLFNIVRRDADLDMLFVTDYFTSWFMILFKLCRAINDPRNKENWIDIQGYAEIVLKDLENGTERNVSGE